MTNNKNREALILDIEEYLKSDMPKYEALYLTSNDYKMILEALQAQEDIQAEADYFATDLQFLQPESENVFYDSDHGFCINTQDVLDCLRKELRNG